MKSGHKGGREGAFLLTVSGTADRLQGLQNPYSSVRSRPAPPVHSEVNKTLNLPNRHID